MWVHLMEAHGHLAEVPEEATESRSLGPMSSQSSVGSIVPGVKYAKQQALLSRRETYALQKR